MTRDEQRTREEMLSAIRQKCVEVYPDKERTVELQGVESGRTFTAECDTIRLADVLLALNVKKVPCVTYTSGQIQNNDTRGTCWWNLLEDSLDEQSDECISFLYFLLCA